jgi:uncharacterized damage-inducible protein DinB
MFYRFGIENNVEGRSMAWDLENPGCYGYGLCADHALAAMPEAITRYSEWIASRNEGVAWVDAVDIELVLEDTWDVYTIDEHFDLAEQGYEVNAWFRHDWKPLAADEIERALKILAWSRDDLLGAVWGLTVEQMTLKLPGERWSIDGILKHVAGAEWWYLDRLGLAFPKEDLSATTMERLEKVRAHLAEILLSLAGSRQISGIDGEFWSPRKLLRRSAWHERDHVDHIHQLLVRMQSS